MAFERVLLEVPQVNLRVPGDGHADMLCACNFTCHSTCHAAGEVKCNSIKGLS